MRKLLFICLFTVILSGCEKNQTLDGSNVESLRISIVEMRNSLPLEEQQRFDEAIELKQNYDETFHYNVSGYNARRIRKKSAVSR